MDGISLADFILASYPNKGITPMKLQKLAYYSKVWSLVAGKPFITALFKKWDYGPVNSAIYNKYKHYKNAVIEDIPVTTPIVDSEQEALLKFILNNYVNYSAYSLSTMTHNEAPWLNTTKNGTITDDAIVDFYSSKPFAKNFKGDISLKGPFHVLHSNSWHSFTLDMEPEEVATFESYSSYDEFQKQSKKAESDFDELIKTLFK